jgi:hypothetical protein
MDTNYMITVYHEQICTTDAEENFHPDVVLTEGIGYIINVTVWYKAKGSMISTSVEKIEKYDSLHHCSPAF